LIDKFRLGFVTESGRNFIAADELAADCDESALEVVAGNACVGLTGSVVGHAVIRAFEYPVDRVTNGSSPQDGCGMLFSAGDGGHDGTKKGLTPCEGGQPTLFVVVSICGEVILLCCCSYVSVLLENLR